MQNSEPVRKTSHYLLRKFPACKESVNKSSSKLCSFSLAPTKMTACDARHWRERILVLFIAHGWLPFYLRMSQSLMHACSQQLPQAEDSLPKAVLEARRFALGKWTLTFAVCFQNICCKTPAAGTTSSKDMLLPSTCAQVSLLGVLRLLLCWRLFSPPSPYLPALPSIYSPHQATARNTIRKTTA